MDLGKVHQGFQRYAQLLMTGVRKRIFSADSSLGGARGHLYQRPIYVTGHGVGGAVAALLCEALLATRLHDPNNGLVTVADLVGAGGWPTGRELHSDGSSSYSRSEVLVNLSKTNRGLVLDVRCCLGFGAPRVGDKKFVDRFWDIAFTNGVRKNGLAGPFGDCRFAGNAEGGLGKSQFATARSAWEFEKQPEKSQSAWARRPFRELVWRNSLDPFLQVPGGGKFMHVAAARKGVYTIPTADKELALTGASCGGVYVGPKSWGGYAGAKRAPVADHSTAAYGGRLKKCKNAQQFSNIVLAAVQSNGPLSQSGAGPGSSPGSKLKVGAVKPTMPSLAGGGAAVAAAKEDLKNFGAAAKETAKEKAAAVKEQAGVAKDAAKEKAASMKERAGAAKDAAKDKAGKLGDAMKDKAGNVKAAMTRRVYGSERKSAAGGRSSGGGGKKGRETTNGTDGAGEATGGGDNGATADTTAEEAGAMDKV